MARSDDDRAASASAGRRTIGRRTPSVCGVAMSAELRTSGTRTIPNRAATRLAARVLSTDAGAERRTMRRTWTYSPPTRAAWRAIPTNHKASSAVTHETGAGAGPATSLAGRRSGAWAMAIAAGDVDTGIPDITAPVSAGRNGSDTAGIGRRATIRRAHASHHNQACTAGGIRPATRPRSPRTAGPWQASQTARTRKIGRAHV